MPITLHPPIIRYWIATCLVLIFIMVGVGGATRLTESGLSIVEWKLISGILPPLSEEAWQREFSEYQTSPQYQQVNTHFGVEEFKEIYWLEYIHRVLGRIIGLTIIVPFVWFYVRKQLSPPLAKRMFLACILVALQGTVGWIMVASGLQDEPRVAPIKLALHLSLAFALFSYLLWTYWQVRGVPVIAKALARNHPASSHNTGLLRVARNDVSRAALMVRLLTALLSLQIILGALVAGLRAGLSYNTWPLMDGDFIPSGLYATDPWWKNHLESVLMVQFQHRIGAYLLAALILIFVAHAWKRLPELRRWLGALSLTLKIQFSLGVLTILTHVHITLAVAHQLMALVLLSVLLYGIYRLPLDHGQGKKN